MVTDNHEQNKQHEHVPKPQFDKFDIFAELLLGLAAMGEDNHHHLDQHENYKGG